MYFVLSSQEIVLLNQYHKCGSRKKVIFPGIQNNQFISFERSQTSYRFFYTSDVLTVLY